MAFCHATAVEQWRRFLWAWEWMKLCVCLRGTEKCLRVPVYVCVGVCDMDVHALVCGLVVVYLLDNNGGFIFVDKTLE